ncbi:MAG: hypothetical protein C0594_16095 [Marinilabiliales bacterium]|nr:MAG: hypothetical protein C0594_16095 [Marinilabiliales bacterium]
MVFSRLFLLALLCFSFSIQSIGQPSTKSDTIYLTITVDSAYQMIQANYNNPEFMILDVRTPSEYSPSHIENAYNYNYFSSTFSSDLDTLDKNKKYLIYCSSGSRSYQSFLIMQDLSFRELYNMQGGLNSWTSSGYPTTDEIPTEINYISDKNVKIYPNPFVEYFTIDGLKSSPTEITISDISGKKILTRKTDEYPCTIKTAHMDNGVYVISIKTSSTSIYKKLIKK